MENKVVKKAIETIDLLQLVEVSKIKGFDLKPFLFQGLLLREKEFRTALKSYDFSSFQGQMLFLYCSSDAIIPMWAYMLLASYLTDSRIPHIFAKDRNEAINMFVSAALNTFDVAPFQGKRVVVKGCSGKIVVNEQNYIKLTQILKPVVKAISFGEACSMVPIAKN